MKFSKKTEEDIFDYLYNECGFSVLQSHINEIEKIIQMQEIEKWLNSCEGKEIYLNEEAHICKSGKILVTIKSVMVSDVMEPRFLFEIDLKNSFCKLFGRVYATSQQLFNYFNH
jgi:hypothetical protein